MCTTHTVHSAASLTYAVRSAVRGIYEASYQSLAKTRSTNCTLHQVQNVFCGAPKVVRTFYVVYKVCCTFYVVQKAFMLQCVAQKVQNTFYVVQRVQSVECSTQHICCTRCATQRVFCTYCLRAAVQRKSSGYTWGFANSGTQSKRRVLVACSVANTGCGWWPSLPILRQ